MTADESDPTGVERAAQPEERDGGDLSGEFTLEEFLVETVTEIRERLDALESLVLAEGFTVNEEGMYPRIMATWTTDHFDVEHDVEVVHNRQVPIEFLQTYELSFADEAEQRRFIELVRGFYAPLVEEGLSVGLHVALPADDEVTIVDSAREAIERIECAAFRRMVSELEAEGWFLVEYGDALSASSFEYRSFEDAVCEVVLCVQVDVSLVPRGDDGSYEADPHANVSLEVPVDAACLDAIMQRHLSGVPLDVAVEHVIGRRTLSYV